MSQSQEAPQPEPTPRLASQQEVDARVKLAAKSMAADPELRAMRARMVPMPRAVLQEKLCQASRGKQKRGET